MKKTLILILILLMWYNIYSQSKHIEYTDISPDGKHIVTYNADNCSRIGTVIRIGDDIPFGTTPNWSSSLERQIGGMAWADYDNDGDLDLATGCYFSQSFPPIPDYEVLIYENINGMLDTVPSWISTDERSTTDVKFADLNNDGRPELLAANGNESFVPSVIYFNSSSGLNTSPGWISQDNNWTVGAAFSDINGDGYLDLAFGNQGNTITPTKPLCVFLNDQSGNLPTIPNWLSADEMISNAVAFGDVDNSHLTTQVLQFTGDGIRHSFPVNMIPIYSIDSVYIDQQPYYQYCFDYTSGWISLGTKPPAGSTVRVVYKYIQKGDMAVSKWANYESGVYFNNNGALNTLPGWTVGHTQSQKGIAFADFDKDGFMDIAISGSNVQTVVYKNNNGTFTGPVWSSNSPGTSAQELIAGDLDHDGYPELAVVHFGNRRVEIFKNRNGVLDSAATWVYIAGSSATAISFGDMNGDGSLDLAVGTARSPVVVFLNTSPPVPVELKSFSAFVENRNVKLIWSTASEINNSGFEIQRSSKDGKWKMEDGKFIRQSFNKEGWEVIGFVEGKGTTTEQQFYTYIDENLPAGKYKYRLKQIDFDGTFEYSNVIEAEINQPLEFSLSQNYPNPFNPVTKIKYTIPQEERPERKNVILKVYDVLGNEIATLVNEEQAPGIYEIEFDGSSLSSGTYFYHLKMGELSETKKLMLVK